MLFRSDVVAGAANSDKYSSVSISYFADYPFILHVKTKEMYRRARKIFRNSGINPKVVFQAPDSPLSTSKLIFPR